jgi:thiol-disulfide isomerase/thioredoxin
MCRKAWLLLVAALLPLIKGSSAAVGVTDLTQSNFTSVLTSLPGPAIILAEFYASWCPACRWGPTQHLWWGFWERPTETGMRCAAGTSSQSMKKWAVSCQSGQLGLTGCMWSGQTVPQRCALQPDLQWCAARAAWRSHTPQQPLQHITCGDIRPASVTVSPVGHLCRLLLHACLPSPPPTPTRTGTAHMNISTA